MTPEPFARPLRWAGRVTHCPKCGHRGALVIGRRLGLDITVCSRHHHAGRATPHHDEPAVVYAVFRARST